MSKYPLGDENEIRSDKISVHHNVVDGTLALTAMVFDGGVPHTTKIVIPAAEVPSLLIAVANEGGALLSEAADAWRRGDCATCSNTRMVKETRPHGGSWTVHCPDCSRNDGTGPFKGFPTVAAAVGRRKAAETTKEG